MPTLYERPESPYWYAEINIGGKSKRISTNIARGKTTRKRALEVARERELELNQRGLRRLSVSLEQAAYLFFEKSDLKASTQLHYAKKIAILDKAMDRPVLCDITLDWVKDLVKRRRLVTSDIQVRRELTALSSVVEYAIEQELEGAPELNPCRLFRKKGLKKPVKKPRWLTPAIVTALFNAGSQRFWKPFILLVLETGLRHEEALGLTWDEVNLQRKIINLGWEREKAGRGRVVPLSDTALRTLTHIAKHPTSPYVFVNPRTEERYKSIGAGWRRLRKRAGVPTARIHDLRHTFASWTRQSGMSKEDRKDVMGHLDDVTQGGYANASIETLVESINKHSPSTLLTHELKL